VPPVPDPKPVPAAPPVPAETEDEKRRRQKPQLYYAVYTKVNLDTGETYAGRARGEVYASSTPKVGDLLPIIYVREGEEGEKHHTKGRFGPAIIENFARATLPLGLRHDDPAYQAIRGREQQLTDIHGGAWSDVGRENTRSGNAIRPVAADNKQAKVFHEMSNFYFGNLAPYTGN
jgi:hypothetical protein